jgi:hypothetical protein
MMSINKNMGLTDRIIRIVAAVVMLFVAFFVPVGDFLSTVLIILGVVFIGTSVISFCPLYLPFKINTMGK